ncbi:MAG: hypothetical protein ACKVI7_09090 [Rhodobacterales bacterium]
MIISLWTDVTWSTVIVFLLPYVAKTPNSVPLPSANTPLKSRFLKAYD